jgi:hypothetical protein
MIIDRLASSPAVCALKFQARSLIPLLSEVGEYEDIEELSAMSRRYQGDSTAIETVIGLLLVLKTVTQSKRTRTIQQSSSLFGTEFEDPSIISTSIFQILTPAASHRFVHLNLNRVGMIMVTEKNCN